VNIIEAGIKTFSNKLLQ